MTSCIRGCRAGGQHLDGCDGTRDGRPCRGCAPREAEHGLLCQPCAWRLGDWLDPTPPPASGPWPSSLLTAWHRLGMELGGLSGITYDSDRVGLTREPPTPLHLARHDARAMIETRLTLWCRAWCEERSLRGPDTWTPPAVVAYLGGWIDGLCAWPAIADMWGELAECMADAHALAPWRAAVRHCDGVPCPHCGRKALRVYSGDSWVTCGTCGALVHRDAYTEHVQTLSQAIRADLTASQGDPGRQSGSGAAGPPERRTA